MLCITVNSARSSTGANNVFGEDISISYDPPRDGNCQFSVVAHLLSAYLEKSILCHDLRQQVVNYLGDSPSLEDGEPICLVNFVTNEYCCLPSHHVEKWNLRRPSDTS